MNILKIEFWTELEVLNFFLLLFASNILMFLFTIGIVLFLRKYFIQFNLNSGEVESLKKDYLLSFLVLFVNIAVGVAGYALLQQGIIQLESKTFRWVLFDFILLILLIDVGMYFAHRLAHKPFIYSHLHKIHHEHESMTPLSLYVMHPLEAFGFGMILIAILSFYQVDLVALLLFIFINWILGVFAHSGIEPSRGKWANYICMTRFHQIHHESPTHNFGFYTPVWDEFFKTRGYKIKNEI